MAPADPPEPNALGLPALGFGLGLRDPHVDTIFRRLEAGGLNVDWFEIITENLIGHHGRFEQVVERLSAQRPVVFHGVSLNIGGTDPLDRAYLDQLKALCARFKPAWISDHLCWTGVHGVNSHDLLPLPLTRDVLDHVAGRVMAVQDRLGRPILLENPSSYVQFEADEMPEAVFLAELAEMTGCGLLLDLNNIHVSGWNHGFDPFAYLDEIPRERVVQIHLAGPTETDLALIDTHDHPVPDRVWALLETFARRAGEKSYMVEWDDQIPDFDALCAELDTARAIVGGAPASHAAAQSA